MWKLQLLNLEIFQFLWIIYINYLARELKCFHMDITCISETKWFVNLRSVAVLTQCKLIW